MIMARLRLRVLVVCFGLGSALTATAQSLPDWAAPRSSPTDVPVGDDPPTTDAPGLPAEPTQVPVDGGLGLLALAGAGYAARKLHMQRKA
ncbi:MAG: hypothetical protein AAFN13_03015 [Bacteroidota bacterium]